MSTGTTAKHLLRAVFLLSPMERQHQPKHGLREFRPGQPTAWQTCSRKAPAITTLALSHNATEYQNSCLQRSDEALWNFRKAHWSCFFLLTGESIERLPPQETKTTRGYTRNFARSCHLRLNNISHVAVARTICHVGTKTARLFIAHSSKIQRGLTLIEPLRPCLRGSGEEAGAMGGRCQFHLLLALQSQGVQHHQ